MPTFARLQAGLALALGCLVLIGGVLPAVVGRDEPMIVAIGVTLSGLGAATVAGSAWMHRRFQRLDATSTSARGRAT